MSESLGSIDHPHHRSSAWGDVREVRALPCYVQVRLTGLH